MPLVKTPVRLSEGSRGHLQNTHAGIVVVQHLAWRRLSDQLFQCGFDDLSGFFDESP
jgi:hypothetical protein